MRRAVGVYVFRDGRYLLTQRGEKARHEPFAWEGPGGEVDENESFEQAGVRELEEEIGVTVKLIDTIYEEELIKDIEGESWHAKIFLAELDDPDQLAAEDGKIAGYGWFTLEEIDQLNLASYCKQDVQRIKAYRG